MMNDTVYLLVSKEDEGNRIDVFVSLGCDLTRSAAQKLIENDMVTKDGSVLKKNYRVCENDKITVEIPEPELLDVTAQDIPIDIHYEDESLLIVNKPKNMVVHPAPGNPDGTLVNALMYHCADKLSSINGVIRPGIVHRLDKDTSGLLIVAKNNDSHLCLANQIKDHSFSRRYRAIVCGNIKDDKGTVDKPIGRSKNDRKKMAVSSDGRNAVTHYEVLKRYGQYTYVELILETGRTHQIRVHMSSLGHPILGDTVYKQNQDKFEKNNADILCGQCLHAYHIGFVHPKSKEYVEFNAPLPEYFQTILEKLDGIYN